MSLTREQYNKIMRILDERRLAAKNEQQRRKEELEAEIPELAEISSELSRINGEEIEARFKKDISKVEKLKKEREALFETKKALIKSYGYPEDYLSVPFCCKKCGDTGYIDGTVKCSCFKALEAELVNKESGLPDFLNAVGLDALSSEIYDDTAAMADLPKGAKKCSQKEYMEKLILPRVKLYAAEFDEEGSHNIFMTGAAGTGKTYLTACIAKTLMESLHTVIYVSASELFSLYSRNEFGRGDQDVMESRISLIEDCDLLIIDDLGTEYTTDLNKSKLFSLIDYRLKKALSIIISSNMDLNEVDAAYGERVASRIKGNYMVLPFFGTDLRLKARRQARL